MIVRMSIEDEDTKLPTRKNNRDAGLDLYAKLRGFRISYRSLCRNTKRIFWLDYK